MTDDGNATNVNEVTEVTKPVKKKKKVRRPKKTNTKAGGWQGGGRPKGSKDSKPRKYVHFTAALQWKVLDTISKNGNIKAAAATAGVSRETVFKYIRENAEFSDLVDVALGKFLAKLEDETSKRIFEGAETKEYDGEGNLVRRIVKQDNDLLKMVLKAADQERYGDKNNVIGVNIDGNNAIGKLAEFLKLNKTEQEEPAVVVDGECVRINESD